MQSHPNSQGAVQEVVTPFCQDAGSPSKRTATDDEIADVVTFLASPGASWITGANIVVDGGYTKQVGF
ncbi:MAG: SDR family oxidoreductase [bacterium]|nr:SDR family oxidoreductase [Gammaproteobacteria bacterium]HIL85529.1 SDR family oxidoreductase [Pseudomonadales bacterium]